MVMISVKQISQLSHHFVPSVLGMVSGTVVYNPCGL